VKSRTRPAPGNHEFRSAGALPYFDYFGTAEGDPKTGYYSYELETWHIIVLKGECQDVGGCKAGSPRKNGCVPTSPRILPPAHSPTGTSRSSVPAARGNDLTVKPLFQALYDANADVVVGGHDHDYERFAPPTPDGAADPKRGIREFVVGRLAIHSRSGEKLHGFRQRCLSLNSEIFCGRKPKPAQLFHGSRARFRFVAK
jgi:hypothetical protein